MAPLISIITPYYNVKKELFDVCVESVKRQTYSNIEWIIVDDGSEKEYADYLLKIEKENSFIKVLKEENSGPAIARNNALAEIKGEYFTFLDADDYLQDTFLEILYNAAVSTDSDIVIGNMLYVNELDKEIIGRGENKSNCSIEMTDINRKMIIDAFFRKNHSAIKTTDGEVYSGDLWTVDNMWGKLYRSKDLSNVLLIPKLIHSQDNIYCLDTMLVCKKLSFVKEGVYYYVKNEGSHSLKRKGIEKYEEYYKELYVKLEKWPEIFTGKMSNMFLDIAYHLAEGVSCGVFYKDLKRNLSHPLIRMYSEKIGLEHAVSKQQKRTIKALKYNKPLFLLICVYVGKIKMKIREYVQRR
ncbi:MAG: glycosyltransferase family 2 protein [Lachnospiraceae bacterium]|nr:glycosyltransferase family 2 protein [Lachnospiraceae bacterium]